MDDCTYRKIKDCRQKHGKDDSVPAQLHRVELAGKDAEPHGYEKRNCVPPNGNIAVLGLKAWSGILVASKQCGKLRFSEYLCDFMSFLKEHPDK